MSAQKPVLPEVFLDQMAEVVRVLGHAQRLRIVEQLDLHGEQPVHRILAAVGGAQGLLSQHLNKLRQAGIIAARRDGREVYYRIAEPHALTILNCMRTKCAALEGCEERGS